MSSLSTTAKNAALTHLGTLIDDVSIHTGDPGASGTSNEVTGGGYERLTPTWATASNGEMALAADLDFSGPAEEDALWYGLWDASVFMGRGQISGDTAFNAAGEFSLTTGTKLVLADPT